MKWQIDYVVARGVLPDTDVSITFIEHCCNGHLQLVVWSLNHSCLCSCYPEVYPDLAFWRTTKGLGAVLYIRPRQHLFTNTPLVHASTIQDHSDSHTESIINLNNAAHVVYPPWVVIIISKRMNIYSKYKKVIVYLEEWAEGYHFLSAQSQAKTILDQSTNFIYSFWMYSSSCECSTICPSDYLFT